MILKRLSAFVGMAAALFVSQAAKADTMLYSSRSIDSSVSHLTLPTFTTSQDYVNYWNNLMTAEPTAPAGYCDTTLSSFDFAGNHSVCAGGSSANIAFHISILFSTATNLTNLSLRAGTDFGDGGTLIVDSNALQTRTGDLWWNGSYADSTQILQGTAALAAGNHRIDIYGAENCCDGGLQAQYSTNGGQTWSTITTASLNNQIAGAAVPEPGTLFLLLGTLPAIWYLRRRKNLSSKPRAVLATVDSNARLRI